MRESHAKYDTSRVDAIDRCANPWRFSWDSNAHSMGESHAKYDTPRDRPRPITHPYFSHIHIIVVPLARRDAASRAAPRMALRAWTSAGDTSPHVPWHPSAGARALWRARVKKFLERCRGARGGSDRDRASGRSSERARRRAVASAVRVVVMVLVVRAIGSAVTRSRRHALSARRADRALESWTAGAETVRGTRVACGAFDGGVGAFKGVSRRFRPRRPRSSGFFSTPRSKTVVLTGVRANEANAATLLEAFLTHYLDFGKIPAENVFVVVHERLGGGESHFKTLEACMRRRGVTYDVYVGSTLLHSELSSYWQRQLAGAVDEEDWVILADLDEHLFVPSKAELGSEKYSIPLFLAEADALGFELVNGVWIDRISSDGSLSPKDEGSLHKTFPRKCRVGPECDVRRSPPKTNGDGKLLPREGMVIAHKLKFDISDVRALHDFAYDDLVPATRLSIHQDNIFPVPISVQHYQWHEGTEEQLSETAASYEMCGMTAAHDALSSLLSSLKQSRGRVNTDTCPMLACSEASTDEVNQNIRRVAIVTTVWEHVDGVSRTMKRFAEYLRGRDDSSVLVMSPDLAERDYVQANSYDQVHQLVAPVPAVEVPGRPEYKMAGPLQARQRAVLQAYNPHVVHVAAPDMLGHSAVNWAAEVGACSVCSYHTAFDTYMQYYHVSLLSHPIRHLLRDFYSLCDIVAVPTYAAAQHLRSMGVPGEKMGFFPRGVNQTMYSPAMRDEEYRQSVFGASPDEIIILWVARIVREKGLQSFMKTIKELNKAAAKEHDLPKFRVVIAGDGPDLGWVRSELSIYDNVVILGHKGGENLAKTYAAGDIFFFPSKTEVIPNNLIEAMASGLPVITDDVGVNRAIVQDDISGIIVKDTEPIPGDVSNYVKALKRLLIDRELAKRMSKAAVDSTVGLTWKRTFESLLHAYDRCRPGLPYARHVPREKLDNPKLYPHSYKPTEEQRDVIVDNGAPAESLLYRISRGITGGYVRSVADAKRDDEVAAHGTFT